MKKALSVLLAVLITASFVYATVGGGDVLFEAKGAGNVTFSHDTHVGMGKQCIECHDSLYVTKARHKKVSMKEMGKGQSCGACHNGKKAFAVKENCKTCHKK
jgi:c(7)-type cytochrome triheme protein